MWEDDNEEKSYTFFRATFDGQDFAIFAKDSFDTNTWVTEGQYSLDAEICPDSISDDRRILVGSAKFCTTVYNAESTVTTKTFPPPVTKLSRREKLKVSVDFTEYSYPQPCLQNFYCGYGATSPSGTGKCPKVNFAHRQNPCLRHLTKSWWHTLAGICQTYNLAPYLHVDKILNVILMNGIGVTKNAQNTKRLAPNAR